MSTQDEKQQQQQSYASSSQSQDHQHQETAVNDVEANENVEDQHTQSQSTLHSSPTNQQAGRQEKDGKANTQHDENDKGKLVEFDDAKHEHPTQWTSVKKWTVLTIVSATSSCVTCTSSVVSTAYKGIERDLNVSEEVAILGLSLFVAGLATGPLLLAPFSEFYGRRPVYIISLTAFFLFGFPVAFANNPAVFFIFRFLTGFVGSAFLSVAGGTVSDLFHVNQAYLPMSFFTCSPFLGPVLGPVFSGFIVQFTTWRWSFYTIIIWSFVQLLLVIFFAPETFAPQILIHKARRLRKQTGDSSYYAQHERVLHEKSLVKTIETSSLRVFKLLALEPMLSLLCLWCAVILGILYLFFELFPIVFAKHNFSEYQTGLSFLGLGIGIPIGLLIMIYYAKRYKRIADQNGGKAPPEERLEAAKLGALLCPISLFIFAFTSYGNVHWIAPIIGSIPFGTGTILIFASVFTFTTDNWTVVAASALGANSVARSSFAAAFPLFANQMADKLSTTGAAALLAGLNVLIIPLPFVFARYGPRLRAKSRFVLN